MTVSAASHWPVIGHTWAVEQLDRAIRHGRMRHAYLFAGPGQIGKTTLARVFAMALNCPHDPAPCGQCRACALIADAHPDDPSKRRQHAQIIRCGRATGARPAPREAYRVVRAAFTDANPNAQTLLKTSEDRPHTGGSTANSADDLLPTIVSRCQLSSAPAPIETVREALEWRLNALQDIAINAGADSGADQRPSARCKTCPNRPARGARRLRALRQTGANVRASDGWLRQNQHAGGSDVWQYWRDADDRERHHADHGLDRADELARLAETVGREAARRALDATRQTMDLLGKNANARLALEVLMLDYPIP
jgi:hypothetical protein